MKDSGVGHIKFGLTAGSLTNSLLHRLFATW